MSKYVGRIITDQAPAGYSVYFDGTGDQIYAPQSTSFDLGAGDWTMEAWIYPTGVDYGSAGFQRIFSKQDVNYYFFRLALGTGYLAFGISTGSFSISSSVAPARFAWSHVAAVRSGNTITLYLNGVSVASGSYSSTPTADNAVMSISGYNIAGSTNELFTGYISNARFVKGTALYTAAFTPPTQLLRITNTSLLTCNSPAIVDQSSNAFAITTNGNAAVSTFTPFTAYNPAPTSSNPLTPAPGVWTLDEALQYTQQGVWPSYAVNAIEDVFSTFLYAGNNTSGRVITNDVDLAGKGGLVWFKNRTTAGKDHRLYDSARANDLYLRTNGTDGNLSSGVNQNVTFNSNGFTINSSNDELNGLSTTNYVSWTFRKQAKFFDVVTYTGNGTNRTISHNLGSVPGTIIIKRTDTTAAWAVYHRSLANTEYLVLNTTAAKATGATYWNSTTPTSTEFSLGTATEVNASGGSATYVAYLFAHDAGGFGAAGTDNVISCGSYTGNASTAGPVVTLGYEPQWILIKGTTAATQQWFIFDTMRGIVTESSVSIGEDPYLLANTSAAETSSGLSWLSVTSTGFQITSGNSNLNGNGENYIYIAIRRGPMRPPTSGTSVFTPDAAGNNASAGGLAFDAGFPVDWYVRGEKSGSSKFYGFSRLTGNEYLTTTSTAAGAASTYADQFDSMTGIETTTGFDFTGQCAWLFRRAPGVFDVVCYTGNGSARTINHNLTIPPEFIIVKKRSAAGDYWQVYHIGIGNSNRIFLNSNDAASAASSWNNTTPTASVFSLGTSGAVNASGATFVAYLFATVGGVSKVGSYTGTGTTQQINCGFTNGSRFVMIKRTDSTGDWYVWDSARGIVAGNDPYLLLNSTAAEVTNTDYVDTYSLGFELSSTAPADLNASGGSYIFLAVA